MLPESELIEIKKELESCSNPIFFFHDDPDGLSSFLLFYRHVLKGRGVCVKSAPIIDERFSSIIKSYNPDKIFVLDVAIVEQSLIDSFDIPFVWIDHHEPLKREKVKYFNPRLYDKTNCVSEICYNVIKKDIWIASAGIVGDWQESNVLDELKKDYPYLIENCETIEDMLFNSKLGIIIKVMSFIMKGRTNEVNQCIKVITRINDPNEILNETTPKGKFIKKQFEKINKDYEKLKNEMLNTISDKKILNFTYKSKEMSYTKDLANEALYKNPDLLIIIGREKLDEVALSLRSKTLDLPKLINEVLVGLNGYGGGHKSACGVSIKTIDYPEFLNRIKNVIN